MHWFPSSSNRERRLIRAGVLAISMCVTLSLFLKLKLLNIDGLELLLAFLD